MPSGIWLRIAGAVGILVALSLVVLGIYRLGLSAGVARGDAKAAQTSADCLADQRSIAQRSSDAYSAELEATRSRAMAAAQADRDAQTRLAAANATLATRVKDIANAPRPVPAECFPADMRLRIDAAADAIDTGAPAGQASADAAAIHVPGAVSGVPSSIKPAVTGSLDVKGSGGLWGLRPPAGGVQPGVAAQRSR